MLKLKSLYYSLISAIIVVFFFCVSPTYARKVFLQPTNRVIVSPSLLQDKTREIQSALDYIRDNGGGTVFLPAGIYIISDTLRIETKLLNPSTREQLNPLHVRLLGAKSINSHNTSFGETILLWRGISKQKAVIEVTHANNTTVENLRIQASAGKRFRYGIFFHRTESGLSGTATRIAPTSLNVLDCGINRGIGNFTNGIRIGDPGVLGDMDQNVDMNYIDNLYVDGATDDNGDTPSNLLDGLNSCGLWIHGSQVQGQYFHNININNCGTGVFLENGQLEIFGGIFSNNIQPGTSPLQCLGDDNHSSNGGINNVGGGDFVFRTGYAAGNVIQDITSIGSYRFFTSFLEDANSSPHAGSNASWQGIAGIAAAIVHCYIKSTSQPNGEVIFSRGNGGPITIHDCDFGEIGKTPQQIVIGQWSQGSVVVSKSRFNHTSSPLFSIPYLGSTDGDPSKISIVDSLGWNGSQYISIPNTFTDPNDTSYISATPAWISPRSSSDYPNINNDFVVDLSRSFNFQGTDYTAFGNLEDIDNAPIINVAIAKIKMESPNGSGTIWFPSGAYVVKTSINLENVSGIRLLGVGGRTAVGINGRDPIKGSALLWNGPTTEGSTLLRISRSENIVVQGLYFSTYYGEGQEGTTTIDNMIHISETGNGMYQTRNIWIEDVGTNYLSSNGPIIDQGVCNTFLRIGDGAETQSCNQITLSRASSVRVMQQGILIDGPSCTDIQLLQYSGIMSKRVVHVTSNGGAFAWIGGGGGNNLIDFSIPYRSLYTDPVITDLDGATGPIFLAGHELQDNYTTRQLQTSDAIINTSQYPNAGKVYIYGESCVFYAPQDNQKLIDFKWTGYGTNKPELYIFGSGIGLVESQADPDFEFETVQYKIAATNGSNIFSMGNLFQSKENKRPWVTSEGSYIQDFGSRSIEKDFLSTWPYDYRNLKYYNSSIGTYMLAVSKNLENSTFSLAWQAAAGDTNLELDWAGLYRKPGSRNEEYILKVDLKDNFLGGYIPAGITEAIDLPQQPGIYELRYFKNGTTRSVYVTPFKVD